VLKNTKTVPDLLILCCFTLLRLFSLEIVIYEGNFCSEFFDDRMVNDES